MQKCRKRRDIVKMSSLKLESQSADHLQVQNNLLSEVSLLSIWSVLVFGLSNTFLTDSFL